MLCGPRGWRQALRSGFGRPELRPGAAEPAWKEVVVTEDWKKAPVGDKGFLWYRAKVSVPASWQGRQLELVVEATGSVGDVRVVKSLHPDLDEAAIASARQWRFTPGTSAGQSIPVIVTMEVSFRRTQ